MESTDLMIPDTVETGEVTIKRPPDKVLAEARTAAQALRDVIAGKHKPVLFNGEQYLEFEDWQTVGKFYGLTAKVAHTSPITFGEAHGFEARAVVVHAASGQEVSAADAMCLTDEPNWSSKPLFQLRSMAQTRACAKALRNVLAWVVVLAGYRPTPAEEIQDLPGATRTAQAEAVTFQAGTLYEGTLTVYTPAVNAPRNSGQKSKPQTLVVEVAGMPLKIGGFKLPPPLTAETVKGWIGTAVQVSYEQNGQYTNLTHLARVPDPAEAPMTGGAPAPTLLADQLDACTTRKQLDAAWKAMAGDVARCTPNDQGVLQSIYAQRTQDLKA